MSTINQYDRLNDPELGSGIYAQTSFKEQWTTALLRLKELDPEWERWYDEHADGLNGEEMLPLIEARIWEFEYGASKQLAQLARDVKAGVNVDGFLLLMAVLDCPPDPRSAAEEHAALLMECPWMDDDLGESPTDTRSQVLG